VIFVVENNPSFHFAIALRTLIVTHRHLPQGHYPGERPVAAKPRIADDLPGEGNTPLVLKAAP
jgi:hypothetical protein